MSRRSKKHCNAGNHGSHVSTLVKLQQRYAKCHREFDKYFNSLVFSCFGSPQKWWSFSPKKWGLHKGNNSNADNELAKPL